jgi:GDPmannose 4,6-dehydratase
MKRALITGITGQDGSYLAELLLEKGYVVHGIIRRSSSFNTGRIDHIFGRVCLQYGDMSDGTGLRRVLEDCEPDEVYNLAGQSHVMVSFEHPEYTFDTNATGTLRLLEAVRDMKASIRVYQAGSSEMFGNSPAPQNEKTPFRPCSPYGVSKVAAHWHAVTCREAYGTWIANGILFNHESPRRGETFVTRKITRAAGRWALPVASRDPSLRLDLGNPDAKRDWGDARDYVRAMWMMLQRDEPDDYVIATGEVRSVRDFYDMAFAGLPDGFVAHWGTHQYRRPTEVHHLCGDATKARESLGWTPSTTFRELVTSMRDADTRLAVREAGMRE